MFSDGYSFDWSVMAGEPGMIFGELPSCEGAFAEILPLDEKHWNAVVFPDAVSVIIYAYDEHPALDDVRIAVGRAGKPVTVRMLVTDVEAKLSEVPLDGSVPLVEWELGREFDGMDACDSDQILCLT
jgi:hypothetical protein